MRKVLLGLVALALFVPASPAQAGVVEQKSIQWNQANVPCAVACPYWVDNANTDVNGDGNPEVYHQSCEKPSNLPGDTSGRYYWEDYRLRVSVEADFLTMRIFPPLDWDSFICATNGEELAIGANAIGGDCDNPVLGNSPVPVGCFEEIIIPVTVGKTYLLRVFNWSDLPATVNPLDGEYKLTAL